MHVQTDENTNYGLYIGPNGGQKEAFFYLKLNKSFMKCITCFGLITGLGISKMQRETKSQFDPVLDTQYILAVPSSLFGNARVKTRRPGQMLGAAPQSAGRANCCWRREIWFFGKTGSWQASIKAGTTLCKGWQKVEPSIRLVHYYYESDRLSQILKHLYTLSCVSCGGWPSVPKTQINDQFSLGVLYGWSREPFWIDSHPKDAMQTIQKVPQMANKKYV